jgi:hypothetical protein
MLDGAVFDPQEMDEMTPAFEAALADRNLVNRLDPVTTLIAKTIIECAKTGQTDGLPLRKCAVEAVTKWKGEGNGPRACPGRRGPSGNLT